MAAATRVIDAWAQPALSHMGARLPEVAPLMQRSGALWETGISPEDMLRQMDAAGIDVVLLSAWHRPGGFAISNDEVATIVRDYPGRFVGIASVDLERPMRAIAELDRAVNELGFKGLRLLPWLWNRPPSDALYYPLYVKCIELDIPFCTQVGHTGPRMPSEPGRPVPYLERVALDFPELRIVGGHIGYPWTDEMIGQVWKHDNVYIDTSAYLPRYYPPQLVQFMRTQGRHKVLFGTNFPMLGFERCMEQARELELPDKVAADFFGGNAARVFKLD
ncbi:MAG: amidohydrolase [Pirellulales bacterium]|nr:amidohydrolase [Pirellulales bacterium]